MKKKIISLVLAAFLICAMAIQASASSISDSRTWNGFTYHTNDTCDTGSYYCVIESDSTEYTLRTDVAVYIRETNGSIKYAFTDGGNSTRLISTNSGTVANPIAYIYSHHYLSGTLTSTQKVWA